MVGMQSPKTYEDAKDLAIRIEAYLPRVPAARINSVEEAEPADRETTYLRQLITTIAQHQGEVIQQAVAALTHENQIQDQEIADLKRVLGLT